jgi:hypothetical protein
MRIIFLILVLLGSLMFGSGCSSLKKLLPKKHKPAAADKNSATYIGVVESVNPEQKFVLVRTEIRIALAPGTNLECRSANGAKSTLVVTPERKMNFLSADVAEGTPAAGDIVILPAQAAAEATAKGTPEGVPALIPPTP